MDYRNLHTDVFAPTQPSPLSSTAPSAMLDLPELVRDFWSTFPCPPPWRPRLLAELNASSRLEPSVGRRVQAFLAGKCHLQHIFSASDLHPAAGLGDLFASSGGQKDGGVLDSVSRDSSYNTRNGNGVLGSDVASSTHSEGSTWCDAECTFGLICAVILAVVIVLVASVVYITRHRRNSRMAATRPSSQRLQMSSSVSDTGNCTEFSNLEVQTDDEMNNPFQFRGLPCPPPSACHLLTYAPHHSNWTCPGCASCHPLLRMGSPGHYYSYPSFAVYETIDNEGGDHVDGSTGDEIKTKQRGEGSSVEKPFGRPEREEEMTGNVGTPWDCSTFYTQLPENHIHHSCREQLSSLSATFRGHCDTAFQQTSFMEQPAKHLPISDGETELQNGEGGKTTDYYGDEKCSLCAACKSKRTHAPEYFSPMQSCVSDVTDDQRLGSNGEIKGRGFHIDGVSGHAPKSVAFSACPKDGPALTLSGYAHDCDLGGNFWECLNDASYHSCDGEFKRTATDYLRAPPHAHNAHGCNNCFSEEACSEKCSADNGITSGQLEISCKSAFHSPSGLFQSSVQPCGRTRTIDSSSTTVEPLVRYRTSSRNDSHGIGDQGIF